MKDEIKEGVDALELLFGNTNVTTEDLPEGVRINIAHIDIGGKFVRKDYKLSFLAPDSYPWADIYPLYVIPPLEREDGKTLPQDIQQINWHGELVSQLSRRTQQAGGTHAINMVNKVNRVLEWLKGI